MPQKIAMIYLIAIACVFANGPAMATSVKEPTEQTSPKPRSSKKSKEKQPAKKVQFLPGSQETTAERSARLKRECKGQVNAGACSGYTD